MTSHQLFIRTDYFGGCWLAIVFIVFKIDRCVVRQEGQGEEELRIEEME